MTESAGGPIQEVAPTVGSGAGDDGPSGITPADADLVAAAQADSAAFEAVYRRYVTRVYRYTRARLATDQDAEDVTTTTFMEAMNGLAGYEEQGRFAPWLFTIARRQVLAHHRRDVPHDDLESVVVPTAAPTRHGDEDAILRRALSRLTPERREVIELRFYADLKIHEIATVLNKGESAVKMLLSRGLTQLRDTLREDPRG